MNKRVFSKLLPLSMLFLCFNANSAANTTVNNKNEVQQSLSELQTSYQSAQRVNIIFSQCHMKYDCIIKALQEMADREKDPLAKELLEKFSKQDSENFDVFNKCFNFERNEVNNALSICMAESHAPPLLNQGQCSEKALLGLIDAGNTVAQMALLKLYEMQADAGKFSFLQQKLSEFGPELSEKSKERCKLHAK